MTSERYKKKRPLCCMRKIFSKLVPRWLTPDRKLKRVYDLGNSFDIFKRNPNTFLYLYKTVDET